MLLELEHIKLPVMLLLKSSVYLNANRPRLSCSSHLIYGSPELLLRRKLITVKCAFPEQSIYDGYSNKRNRTYRE